MFKKPQGFKISALLQKLFSTQLKRNMVFSAVTSCFNIGIMILVYPLYLYFLGYERYGTWALLASVLTFSQMSDLGISSAVMKLSAEEYGRNNIAGIRAIFSAGSLILLLVGILALTVILIFRDIIPHILKLPAEDYGISITLLPYIGLLSIAVLLNELITATLSGLGRMDLSSLLQSVGRLAGTIVSILLLWKIKNITALLVGSAVAVAVTIVLSLICVCHFIKLSPFTFAGIKRFHFGRLFGFGGFVFGTRVSTLLLGPVNKILLSWYSGAGVASVTIYDIAFNASMQIRAISESGLRPFLPATSGLAAQLTHVSLQKIRDLHRYTFNKILNWGLPLHIFAIVMSVPFLKIWLGSRYVPELGPAVMIMVGGSFLSLAGVPAWYILLGLGKPVYCFIAGLIQLGVDVVLAGCIIIITSGLSSLAVAAVLTIAMGITSFFLVTWYRKTARALHKKITNELTVKD
jgi:O-antigen/teichoic acid export membrane protein